MNRLELDDMEDWISDKTEFSERDNFLSYLTLNESGHQIRRILYFAVLEEKDRFLEQLKFNLRSQVREELIRLVQTDDFIDLVIDRLKAKLSLRGNKLLGQL